MTAHEAWEEIAKKFTTIGRSVHESIMYQSNATVARGVVQFFTALDEAAKSAAKAAQEQAKIDAIIKAGPTIKTSIIPSVDFNTSVKQYGPKVHDKRKNFRRRGNR